MLTKVLTHLLLPPGSVFVLLLVALLLRWRGWRRTAWTLGVLAVLGLAALSTGKVADALARGLESAYPAVRVPLSEEADAIVVLGGTLKPALPPRYLPDLDERLSTIHQLNTETQRRLNGVGIEFAFPTRELYIRSTETCPGPGSDDG